MEQSLGEDTVERWRAYLDVLFGVFQRTLARAQLSFRGLNIGCRRIPESKGKHFAFWHLIQEGFPEEDRIPDLDRCRRLLWVAWVIQNAGQDPAIRVFRQTPRHGDKTWALWLFEHDYAVILAERSGYYLLKTAFLVTKENKREELDRDWQASQNPKKS
jgi:hypothetical protein